MANNELAKWTPPTIAELTETLESAAKTDILNIALNTEPPANWIKEHPTIRIKIGEKDGKDIKEPLRYIPIDKQRLLGRRFFGNVKVEILRESVMFQSVVVSVRLHYKHPITGEDLFMDGIGATGVQTDAGFSASDLTKIKFDAVMKAAPAAASYAEKNAYDKIGRIFGGEIQKNALQFTENIAMFASAFYNAPDIDDIKELYEMKKDALTPEEMQYAERIINNQEKNSYHKLHKSLQAK